MTPALVDVGLVRASPQDLLRLVVVPVFAWAAYRDVRTRRVPNRTWYPLVALGLALLAADAYVAVQDGLLGSFALRVGISLFLVVPLAYAFWWFGGFGGADFKAIATLAVLVPTYPVYLLPAAATDLGLPGALPVARSNVRVFSFTVLTNAVLAGATYPLWVGLRNAAAGQVAPAMFVGKPVALDRLPTAYGSLLGGRLGLQRGLDLDALRMYLRWRDTTLAALLSAPAAHRDPASVPEETRYPGDGAVGDRERRAVGDGGPGVGRDGPATADRGGTDREDADDDGTDREDADADGADRGDADGDRTTGADRAVETGRAAGGDDGTTGTHADPWAADRFVAEVGEPYGTTAEDLREGLERLVRAREAGTVWVTPGTPFVVPLFVGLVVAFTVGDVLFGALVLAGLVPGGL